MTNTSVHPIRKVLGILTSVSIAAAGLCLMGACVSIYRSGAFTREIVAARFAPISLPVYLCLALIVLSFVLELCLPGKGEKPRASQTPAQILARLEQKTDLSAWDEDHVRELNALGKKRSRASAIRMVVFLFCGVYCLTYALHSSNFHSSQINSSMIRAMCVFLPALAISFATAVWAHFSTEKCLEQEIALLKQAPVKAEKVPATAAPAKKQLPVKAVVLTLAVVLILFGFFTGGTADVLTKAVNICTECVGLG